MTVDQLIKELLRLKDRQGGTGRAVIMTTDGHCIEIDDVTGRLNDIVLEPRESIFTQECGA